MTVSEANRWTQRSARDRELTRDELTEAIKLANAAHDRMIELRQFLFDGESDSAPDMATARLCAGIMAGLKAVRDGDDS